jgi:hypothetical protein
MDLYLLAELKTIALKITTVDMLKPPADFRYVTVLKQDSSNCISEVNSVLLHFTANRFVGTRRYRYRTGYLGHEYKIRLPMFYSIRCGTGKNLMPIPFQVRMRH